MSENPLPAWQPIAPPRPDDREHDREHKHHRHQGNPCDSPPKYPANLVFAVQATEAETHLRFTAKIKWDEVTEDADGFPAKVDLYEIVYVACDASGVPVESQDSRTRYRVRRKQPLEKVRITDASAVASVATFTTGREHGWEVGDKVIVASVVPGAYNGTWTVTATPGASTFKANIGSTPADLDERGTATDGDDSLHVITEQLPRPRLWYWKARARVKGRDKCWSPWSPWTDPVLPWTGADPQPPAPAFVDLGFDRKGQHHHNPWRGYLIFTPVRDWDVPGGDTEDDLSRYAWRIEVSEDNGASWHKHDAGTVEDKQDGEGSENVAVVFRNIRRRNEYRAWLKGIDRFNRRGPWAGPFPSSSGVGPGGTPNAVTNVQVNPKGPRRLRATWEDPPDFEDTDYWEIEWWRRNPLTLMDVNRSRNRNDVYRVPEADKTKAHFAIVYAVDVDDVHSTGTTSADEDETGDYGTGDSLPPIGVTVLWHGSIPAWAFRCNGQQFNPAVYPILGGVLGSTFNTGGETSGWLRVPDFRRRTVRGVGDGGGGNSEIGASQLADTDGQGETVRWEILEQHPGGDSGDSGAHRHGLSAADANITVPSGAQVLGNVVSNIPAGGNRDAAGPQHGHTIVFAGGSQTGQQDSAHHHSQSAGTMNSASSPSGGGGPQHGHARRAYARAHFIIRHD